MKEQKLLSTSVLVEAVSVALKSLTVDDEERTSIMEELQASIAYEQNRSSPIAFLKGKAEDECLVLKNVAWLEADGCYTKFHCMDGSTHILTANLVSTLRQLKANGWDDFLRIHKSYAVNFNHIKSKCGNTLRVGKTELTIGRTYREYFEKHIIILNKLS